MYDQKALLQAATNAQSVSPIILNSPFSNANLNQPNMLDNAALFALSNQCRLRTRYLTVMFSWVISPVIQHRGQIRWYISANKRNYETWLRDTNIN